MSDTIPPDKRLARQYENVQQAKMIQDDMLGEMARRKATAAQAESILKFSLDIQSATHKLLAEMLLRNMAGDGIKFRTPQGRNAMLVLALGDDAVGVLSDKLYEMQNPTESEPKSKKDDPDWWKNGGEQPA